MTDARGEARLIWRAREHRFDLTDRVLVMGIVNVTPDSFSDGGRYLASDEAIAHGRRLLAEGADVLDLGAESTRPGSDPVPAVVQRTRLMPVVEALVAAGACVSIDTTSAEVARACLAAGAAVVNDVSALGEAGMADVVAGTGAGVVLTHMQGTPRTMQRDPKYDDVTAEVRAFLAERIARGLAAGIPEACIAIDPGIGFGKSVEHNLTLIARLDELAALGRPVVLGASRKGFLGTLTGGAPADRRLEASLAAAAAGVVLGARIVRVHDVEATVRAVPIARGVSAHRRI